MYYHSLLTGLAGSPSAHSLHTGPGKREARWCHSFAQSPPMAFHLTSSENQALPWPLLPFWPLPLPLSLPFASWQSQRPPCCSPNTSGSLLTQSLYSCRSSAWNILPQGICMVHSLTPFRSKSDITFFVPSATFLFKIATSISIPVPIPCFSFLPANPHHWTCMVAYVFAHDYLFSPLSEGYTHLPLPCLSLVQKMSSF